MPRKARTTGEPVHTGAEAKTKVPRPNKRKKAPGRRPAEVAPKKPGRKTLYKPEYPHLIRLMCQNAATDVEIADAIGVSVYTLWNWAARYPELSLAMKVGKGEFDDRIERSLAQRAVGYTYDATKIFMPAGAKEAVRVPYREHCPPDPSAAKIWLAARRPNVWREKQVVEHGVTDSFAALLRELDGHSESIV